MRGGIGAAVGPQCLLPGRVLERFVEQIDEDGVVLAVVDGPVICSDKFLQFLFCGVEVPQLQFIDRVAESSLPWRFHSCRSWRKWSVCYAGRRGFVQFLDKVVDMPVGVQRQVSRTVKVPQIQFITSAGIFLAIDSNLGAVIDQQEGSHVFPRG